MHAVVARAHHRHVGQDKADDTRALERNVDEDALAAALVLTTVGPAGVATAGIECQLADRQVGAICDFKDRR